MKTTFIYLFVILLSTLLYSCDSELELPEWQDKFPDDSTAVSLDSIDVKSVVLFQYDYMNLSWGSQHFGYFIDKYGQVKKYDSPENWYMLHDSLKTVPAFKLHENYGEAKDVVAEVPLSELKLKVNKFSLVKDTITEITAGLADAGTTMYYCYMLDTATNNYRRIFLAMEGTGKRFNPDKEAVELRLWLDRVLAKLQ